MSLKPCLAFVLTASIIASCAHPQSASDPVGDAISQPFEDLSLIRDKVPEPLIRATAAPYALEGLETCPKLAAAITELDGALGPDFDAKGPDRGRGQGMVGDLLKGALGLPFRGVIRRVTGAATRDQAQANAVLAGVARRGFLKGAARAKACAITP